LDPVTEGRLSQSKRVREHQFIFKEFDLAQLSNGWVFSARERSQIYVRFGSKADILGASRDVRFTPKSDIDGRKLDVRFVPIADIGKRLRMPLRMELPEGFDC
jgi:hypothetical protein